MRKPHFRASTAVLLLAAILAGIMLFRISERVQVAEDNLTHMQEIAAKESEAIRVLRAEWDYLNRPDRIESLARQHLHMDKPAITQVMTDGGDLPPVPPPVETQPVSAEPAPAPKKPTPARIEPRNDTDQFNALLNRLQPANGGDE